jgi:hypothetical protein
MKEFSKKKDESSKELLINCGGFGVIDLKAQVEALLAMNGGLQIEAFFAYKLSRWMLM